MTKCTTCSRERETKGGVCSDCYESRPGDDQGLVPFKQWLNSTTKALVAIDEQKEAVGRTAARGAEAVANFNASRRRAIRDMAAGEERLATDLGFPTRKQWAKEFEEITARLKDATFEIIPADCESCQVLGFSCASCLRARVQRMVTAFGEGFRDELANPTGHVNCRSAAPPDPEPPKSITIKASMKAMTPEHMANLQKAMGAADLSLNGKGIGTVVAVKYLGGIIDETPDSPAKREAMAALQGMPPGPTVCDDCDDPFEVIGIGWQRCSACYERHGTTPALVLADPAQPPTRDAVQANVEKAAAAVDACADELRAMTARVRSPMRTLRYPVEEWQTQELVPLAGGEIDTAIVALRRAMAGKGGDS